MKAVVKSFLQVMKALCDPTRIKILKILERRSMCVCDLQAALGTAQSTTSKHLKILEAAGLGIVTPFCSCSAVPLFLGFVTTGVPLGVTFTSPKA